MLTGTEYTSAYAHKCTGFEQTFKGFKLQMIILTFKVFSILILIKMKCYLM